MKLGEYKNRPIISGDNRRYKNELTEKMLVELLGGSNNNGSGEAEGGMKYYDCLFDFLSEEGEHQDWNLANVKFVNMNSGDVYIAPDGWNGVEWGDDNQFYKVAVAVPQGRRYYANGRWLDEKEMYLNTLYFDPDTHIEITEEEFYHIPEDETLNAFSQEEKKVLFDKLWALVERYGDKVINESIVCKSKWKSLNVNCNDGYEDVTINISTILGFDTNSERKAISFLVESENEDDHKKEWNIESDNEGYKLVWQYGHSEVDTTLPTAPKSVFYNTYEDRKLLHEWINSVSKGNSDADILPCNTFKIRFDNYSLVIRLIRGGEWSYIETIDGSPYRVEDSSSDYAIMYDD